MTYQVSQKMGLEIPKRVVLETEVEDFHCNKLQERQLLKGGYLQKANHFKSRASTKRNAASPTKEFLQHIEVSTF